MENSENLVVVTPESKEGRIIIRNLVFTLGEKQLRKLFRPFGEIVEINLPIKNVNNENKGFGFVQFKNKKSGVEAIKKLNGTEYKGRTIALDFSLPSRMYKKAIHTHEIETKKKESVSNQKQMEDKEDVQKEESQEDLEEEDKGDTGKEENNDVNMEEETQDVMEIKKPVKARKEKNRKVKKREKKEYNSFEPELTVFVKNINFVTTQEQYEEFFKQYGELNYAVLCKSKAEESETANVFKGTGFIQFKSKEDAQKVLQISQNLENYYENRRKNKKSKVEKPEEEVILNELELEGRRLIVIPPLRREEVKSKMLERKKSTIDKRNLYLTKEGLVNSTNFTNSVQENIERLRFLNLPRRDFEEKNLKELITKTIEERIANLQESKEKKRLKSLKQIKQVKLLRDGSQVDGEGKERLKGEGFVEFGDHDMALYCARELNNLKLFKTKGIIIDFALEDHRALEKRKKRRELALKKKKSNNAISEKKDSLITKHLKEKSEKKEKQEKRKVGVSIEIGDIEDVGVLKKLLKETKSRGKRQRIKKKLKRLGVRNNEDEDNTESIKNKNTKMIKKSEKGMKEDNGEEENKGLIGKRKLNPDNEENLQIEKQIMNKRKNKKREQRRHKQKEEDQEINSFMKIYKKKLLPQLKLHQQQQQDDSQSD